MVSRVNKLKFEVYFADLNIQYLYFIFYKFCLIIWWIQILDGITEKNLKQSFCCYRYDMWSVGVVMLEMVLGTPNIFQINAFTRALLDRHLEGWNEGVKELAYKYVCLLESCNHNLLQYRKCFMALSDYNFSSPNLKGSQD